MRASHVHAAAHLRLRPVRGCLVSAMAARHDRRQGLWNLTGHGNYFKRPGFLKSVARRDHNGRPQLADSIRIGHVRPNDLAESYRCRHGPSPRHSKRLGLISIEPGLRRRRCLDKPVPIKLRGHALALLSSKQVLQQLQVLQGDDGG